MVVFAPQYALHYKFADALSATQFQKYAKRGYDVAVDLVHAGSSHKLWPAASGSSSSQATGARTAGTAGSSNRSSRAPGEQQQQHPGQRYFNKWCATGLFAPGMPFMAFKAVHRGQPRFELWAFSLLARAWATGGVLADFTTLAARAITSQRGLDLCPDQKPPPPFQPPFLLAPAVDTLSGSGAAAAEVPGSSGVFEWPSPALAQPEPPGASTAAAAASTPAAAAAAAARSSGEAAPHTVKRVSKPTVVPGPFSSLAPPPQADPAAAAAAVAASGCDGGLAARFGPFDPALRWVGAKNTKKNAPPWSALKL